MLGFSTVKPSTDSDPFLLVLMYAAWAEGQTDGGDAGAEPDRGTEGDDGKVIIQGVWIKAGVPHKGDRHYSVKIQKAFPKLFT